MTQIVKVTQNLQQPTLNVSSAPMVNLRCRSCRKLFKGPSTDHETRCQSCDVGTLEVVAKISQRMWREHERAFDQRKGAKAS